MRRICSSGIRLMQVFLFGLLSCVSVQAADITLFPVDPYGRPLHNCVVVRFIQESGDTRTDLTDHFRGLVGTHIEPLPSVVTLRCDGKEVFRRFDVYGSCSLSNYIPGRRFYIRPSAGGHSSDTRSPSVRHGLVGIDRHRYRRPAGVDQQFRAGD